MSDTYVSDQPYRGPNLGPLSGAETDWAAFAEPAGNASKPSADWSSFAAPKDKGLADTAIDAAKSLGAGTIKGATALGGMAGDLSGLLAQGSVAAANYIADKTGIDQVKSPLSDSTKASIKTALDYVPTNASLQKNFEDYVTPLHKPETTYGDYAEKVGEYIPAALTGGGGLLRKAAFSVLPGMADEGARKALPNYADYAGPVAGVLAGGLTALGTRPGSAAQAIKAQLPDGITAAHVDRAEKLIAAAKNRGIDLTWPEALSKVSGRPVLTDMQRILESSPETRGRMSEYFSERPQQFDRAALNEFGNVAAPNARPSTIGPQAGEAAQAHMGDVRQSINRASEPFYHNAEGVLLTPQEMVHVKTIPGYQQARDAVRKDPQLNSYVSHLPDNSVGFLNEVKKYFDQHGKNAASKFNPNANQQVAAVHSKAAEAMKQIGEAKSGDYAIALAVQKQGREQFLQPLLDGPLGRLAKKDVTTQKAINALFPESPLPNSHHEIAEAVGALAAKNPFAAKQLVRAHLESTFNEATRSLQGGANQYGAAGWAKKIVGNVQQRENLQAAIEALPNGKDIWKGVSGFLEAAEATGTRQPKGSLTSFNTADRKLLEGGGLIGEGIATGLSPGKWWSVVKDKYSSWNLGNNLNELATIFTDPASGKLLKRIANMPRGSGEAQFLAARLIAQAEQSASNSAQSRR